MTVSSRNVILQLSLVCNFPLQPIYALNNILHVISPQPKMQGNLLLNPKIFINTLTFGQNNTSKYIELNQHFSETKHDVIYTQNIITKF